MNCQEYQEIIAAHVDRALSSGEQEEAERHLAGCRVCLRLYKEQKALCAYMATHPLLRGVPAALEQRVRLALAEEDQRRSWWGRWREVFTLPRLALGLAAAGLVVLFFWTSFQRGSGEDLLQRTAQDFARATRPDFTLDFRTEDPQVLEASLNQSGQLDFRTRVLDFRSLGYRLKGGAILKEGKGVAALALYEGPEGPILCRRFKGTLSLLPPGGEKRNHHVIYDRGGLTFCFTQEGEMVCSLVSRIPKAKFVQNLELVFFQPS